MYLDQYTGRGVRIAVIDSGVHATHPHITGGPYPPDALREDPLAPLRITAPLRISGDAGAPLRGGVTGGVAIREDGSLDDDYVDRLGHGTAVTAAIREKAPAAEILAIKIFWRSLATDAPTLVRAIDEASARGARLINLSLGTTEGGHAQDLQAAVTRAAARGVLIVAAVEDAGVQWLPGSLDGVTPVQLDWGCARDAYRILHVNGRKVIEASGYPRDIPGVPRERNLKGVSFAVANATGFVARALEASPNARPSMLFDILQEGAL